MQNSPLSLKNLPHSSAESTGRWVSFRKPILSRAIIFSSNYKIKLLHIYIYISIYCLPIILFSSYFPVIFLEHLPVVKACVIAGTKWSSTSLCINLNLPRNPLAVLLELALNSISKSGPELIMRRVGGASQITSITAFILADSESKIVSLSMLQLKSVQLYEKNGKFQLYFLRSKWHDILKNSINTWIHTYFLSISIIYIRIKISLIEFRFTCCPFWADATLQRLFLHDSLGCKWRKFKIKARIKIQIKI